MCSDVLILKEIVLKGDCLCSSSEMLKNGFNDAFGRDWSRSGVATVSKDKRHVLTSTGSPMVGWLYCGEVMPHIGQALPPKTPFIVLK